MDDGLIVDDERNNAAKNQPASARGTGGPHPALPTYNQAIFSTPDSQSGYPYLLPTSPYVVSPLQPTPVVQAAVYHPAYQNPPQQSPSMFMQQFPPYGQLNNPTYGVPQQQQPIIYQSGDYPVFRGSDDKEIVSNQLQSIGQSRQYEPPPDQLSSDIINVRFTPVSLHGDDQHHTVKAIHKVGGRDRAQIGAIVGTYLQKKRIHEQNRLQNHLHFQSSNRSTPSVALFDDLMDKLESLSRAVLTEHRHTLDAQTWTDVIHPHRRAIFAELYNNNPDVRGFCSGLEGGPTAFPLLDEWALGTRRHDLSFQRAGRRGPNWSVARELLSQVRTVILLDDSGSMAASGHMSSGSGDYAYGRDKSRWDQARDLLAGIAPLVSKYSRYGIDIHFLNRANPFHGLHTTHDVLQAFRVVGPGGGTPTGRRVNEILDAYMCALRYNRSIMPLNLIVITDGEAQDESLLHKAIEHHVTKIVHRGFQAHQFGMEFLQVGDDEEATQHLEKLEEEVSRHHHAFQRDVVGVTPMSRQTSMNPDQLLGIVLSGIDARMNGYMRHRGINV